jgi:hypothetical protein
MGRDAGWMLFCLRSFFVYGWSDTGSIAGNVGELIGGAAAGALIFALVAKLRNWIGR